MSERDYAPLSIACVRGLCEKIYEKRKFAGVEIEKYKIFLYICLHFKISMKKHFFNVGKA